MVAPCIVYNKRSSHGEVMAYNEPCLNSMRIPWEQMKPHRAQWDVQKSHWGIMDFIMGPNGNRGEPWRAMKRPWNSMELPWSYREIHENTWNPMGHDGNVQKSHWDTMDFRGPMETMGNHGITIKFHCFPMVKFMVYQWDFWTSHCARWGTCGADIYNFIHCTINEGRWTEAVYWIHCLNITVAY
jgi:hypothetical protein